MSGVKDVGRRDDVARQEQVPPNVRRMPALRGKVYHGVNAFKERSNRRHVGQIGHNSAWLINGTDVNAADFVVSAKRACHDAAHHSADACYQELQFFTPRMLCLFRLHASTGRVTARVPGLTLASKGAARHARLFSAVCLYLLN